MGEDGDDDGDRTLAPPQVLMAWQQRVTLETSH